MGRWTNPRLSPGVQSVRVIKLVRISFCSKRVQTFLLKSILLVISVYTRVNQIIKNFNPFFMTFYQVMIINLLLIFFFSCTIENKVYGIDIRDSQIKIIQALKPQNYSGYQHQKIKRTANNIVGFDKNILLFGQYARAEEMTTSKHIYSNLNLFMSLLDQLELNVDLIHQYYFKSQINGNRTIFFNLTNIEVTLEHLYGLVITNMKRSLNISLFEQVNKTVIVIPINWGTVAQSTLCNIGAITSMEILQIIDAATAAALKYSVDRDAEQQQTIVFINAGSQYIQASAVKFFKSKKEIGKERSRKRVDILSKGSVINTRAEDIDNKIVKYLRNILTKNFFDDIYQGKSTWRKLWKRLPQIKEQLAFHQKVNVQVEGLTKQAIFSGELRQQSIKQKLQQQDLSFLFDKIINEAKIDKDEITALYFTERESNLHLDMQSVKQYFKGIKILVADESHYISEGAALYSANISGQLNLDHIQIRDCTLSLEMSVSVTFTKPEYDDQDWSAEVQTKELSENKNQCSNQSIFTMEPLFSSMKSENKSKTILVRGPKRGCDIQIELFDKQKRIKKFTIFKSHVQTNKPLYMRFILSQTYWRTKVEAYYDYLEEQMSDYKKLDLHTFQNHRYYSQYHYQIIRNTPNLIRQYIFMQDNGQHRQFGQSEIVFYHQQLLKSLYKLSTRQKMRRDVDYLEQKIQTLISGKDQSSFILNLAKQIQFVKDVLQNQYYRYHYLSNFEKAEEKLNSKIRMMLVNSNNRENLENKISVSQQDKAIEKDEEL